MKQFFKRTLLWVLSLAGISLGAGAQNPDPRSLTIYQIMVASFQHGDGGAPGYNAMWGPDGHTKNGNIRGIINALDHIRSMGANAIWLTPVFDSTSALGGEKLQATGYFTNDFFKIDPRFGTFSEMKELVDEAHRRGMYVFLDGVFGHHGGVTAPSPSGYKLDTTAVMSDRPDGGYGNIKYPESLDYIKEVATYWIDTLGIDGWRLDQAYQAMQGGHNYWHEIRGAVEQKSAERKASGERWGTLGYMVGEDWGPASRVNIGVYNTGGLLSAFDFQGKETISGAMQEISPEDSVLTWDQVTEVLSPPTARGYLNDSVMPNLYLSNHDGYRLADHFDPKGKNYYGHLKTRHAILAAYSGPITLYYGDEYGDRSLETTGGQKDNISRTSGHLEARDRHELELRNYIAQAMAFRAANPAMWRGVAEFERIATPQGEVLVVTKTDPESDNRVRIIFSQEDTIVKIDGKPRQIKAWEPVFEVL